MKISKKKLEEITQDLWNCNNCFIASIDYLTDTRGKDEDKIKEEIVKANFFLGKMYGVESIATTLGIYEVEQAFNTLMEHIRHYMKVRLSTSYAANILLNKNNKFTALGLLYEDVFSNRYEEVSVW